MVEQSEAPAPKKKNLKFLRILLPVAAVAVVLALVIGIFAPTTGNSFGKNVKGAFVKAFGEPEEYFQFVEEETAMGLARNLSRSYGQYRDSFNADVAGNASLKLTVSEECSDLIKSMSGVSGMDFEWLNGLELKLGSNKKGDLSDTSIELLLGENSILSAQMIMDNANQMLYAALPTLSDKFMAFDMEEMLDENMMGSTQMMDMMSDAEFIAVLPTEDEINELLERYISLALSQIEEVEMEEEKVSAGDYEQKLTVLEFSIDGEDAGKIITTVFEAMQDDEDLKEIVIRIADYLIDQDMAGDYDDADEIYDDFQDVFDSAIDVLDDLEDTDVELTWRDYVNSDHEVVGRTIEFDDEEVFHYLQVQEGKNIGFEAEMATLKITGEGTMVRDVINAEYVFKMDGEKLLTMTLTDWYCNLNDQKMSGSVVMKPDFDGLTGGAPAASLLALTDLAVGVNVDANKDKAMMEVNILSDEEVLIGLTLTSENKSASKVTIPEKTMDVTDEEELMEWVDELDFDKLIDALEKTDIPSELLDRLESMLP